MKIHSTIERTRAVLTGLLLTVVALAASGLAAQTALTDGVAHNGNVAGGVDDFYTIAVPADQTSMDIDVDFAGGDIIDMLVSFNQAPHYGTPWAFHYGIGNSDATGEHMTLHLDTGAVQGQPALQAGTWHILIRGFGAGGAYTLTADHSGPTALSKNTAIAGDITNADSGYFDGLAGSMAFDENDYYTFDIPANASSLTVDLSGLSADLNLYARNGSAPAINGSLFDASAVTAGTGNEQIVISTPAAGTWYFLVDGASDAESSYSVSADYAVPALTDGVAIIGNVAGGAEHVYSITVPANATSMDIDVDFAGGDIIDMLVSKDVIPHYGSPWSFHYGIGNADANGEHMTLHLDTGETQGMPALQAATWYILVRGFGAGGAYTLEADYEAPTALSDGVWANGDITNADSGYYNGLAGSMDFDENDYFSIEVPSNAASLTIDLAGLSADLNLYARANAAPTALAFDDSSINVGTANETIFFSNPVGGTWYFLVDGSADAESAYSIVADIAQPSLTDGVAVNGNVSSGEDHIYTITVPANATTMDIDVTFAGGDIVDMLVSKDALPHYGSPFAFDYAIGNADATGEHMTLNLDTGRAQGMPHLQAGTWYILLRGFGAGGAYTLTADFYETENGQPSNFAELTSCTPVNGAISNADSGWYNGLAGGMAFDENDYYAITVPAGQSLLNINLTGLSADLNLYVMENSVPVVFTSNYTHSSTNAGSVDELLTINNPIAGQYWIVVDGAADAESSYTIEACYAATTAATLILDGSFTALPQGQTIGGTITKVGGAPFVAGMTIDVAGSGVTAVITQVVSIDQITVDFTATRVADVAAHSFEIKNGTIVVSNSSVDVFYPQQLISYRQGGSTQEPTRNATMGGNSVYLHNGEFRHDLPILSLPGRMLPLSVGITYRSQLHTIGSVGAGWTASFDRQLIYFSGSDEVEVRLGSGSIRTYVLASGGTAGVGPYFKTGCFYTVSRNDQGTSGDVTDDEFTFNYAHGSTATFEAISVDVSGAPVYRETSFADRYGNETVCIYNAEGQIEEMRSDLYDAGIPARNRIIFEYNDHGRLFKITDYADYSAQSSVIGSSYIGNREWGFLYNSDAQLTDILLPKTERYYSNTKGANYRTRVTFTYDTNDNLLEVIDARQNNESTPLGWLKNHFDANDRVDYQDVGRDSAADATHRQYIVDAGTLDVSVIDAEKHRSQYILNANGTLANVKHHTGGWLSDLTMPTPKLRSGDEDFYTTSYVYDSELHTIEVNYPKGNSSEYRYDIGNADHRARGNLLRVLSKPVSSANLPADQVNGLLATFTYESVARYNLLKTSVSPRAYILGASYDIVSNTGITTDDSLKFTTTNNYYFSHASYPDGTLEKTTTPTVDSTVSPDTMNSGQVLESAFTYNSFGQTLTSTDQIGVETAFAYGLSGFDKGFLTEVKAGNQVTPLKTTYKYNSVGAVVSVTDPKGHSYTNYINQLGQGVRSETPQVTIYQGTATYYSKTLYDLNGNVSVASVSDITDTGTILQDIDSTFTYNILDMVKTITEEVDVTAPDRVTSFEYDLVYRSFETTLPEGNRAGTDYDELNRAIKSYSGYDGTNVDRASALLKSEVFYDKNSNVDRAVDGRSNDSHFYYDGYDRMYKSEDRLLTSPNYSTYIFNKASQVTQATQYGKRRYWDSGSSSYQWSTGSVLAQSKTQYDNLGRAYKSSVLAKSGDGSPTNLGYGVETLNNMDAGWSTSRVKFRANGQLESTFGDLYDLGETTGLETKYEYDSYNRLRRIIDDADGGGASTLGRDNYDEYFYDANSNVTGITAHLFDSNVGSGQDKVVTNTFEFDEINRMVKDYSPEVVAGNPSSRLERFHYYDSRSNRTRTIDRKNVERKTKFDYLSRPIRFQVTDSSRRSINANGFVSTVTESIVSRTVYDDNSRVAESIGPNGNRSYTRYDLADRWVQTEHADGGAGTPNKTTAGNSHTISQVGSLNFWTPSNAFDGNGNLLKIIDENETVTSFVYDENDLPTSESGAAKSGNQHEIEGETGMSYLYDGMYRAIYGETHEGSDTLTETDSVFNTLSALERQTQTVHQLHPNKPTMSSAQTIQSKYDESGRRYQRSNPSSVTRTSWEFDRKSRPTETNRDIKDSGSWITDLSPIAEYDYLGGGLFHSKQVKRMWQAHSSKGGGQAQFEFITMNKRDNLLRIEEVRHTRDDADIGFGERLIGRYQYAYDNNSMMKHEARWFHDDSGVGGSTPDETDFYFYDSTNKLEKAVYAATQFSGGDINLGNAELASNELGDDTFNMGTYSDRIYYARRKSGTRAKVNWYRGAANKTDLPTSKNDTNSGPDLTTNYNTSDDPSADPDTSPTSNGQGSRHNYTAIGQVNMTYDSNRNVQADGTRQFRYNYKNQLRRVWRKSDGESLGEIAKYREDAFGRRVHVESKWELGRRVYFDTRFELDIDMDPDGNGTDMGYVDGGIRADQYAFGFGSTTYEEAEWDARVKRPNSGSESHYYDFLINCPASAVLNKPDFRGMVAYGHWELRIFLGRYELWNTISNTILGTYLAPSGSTDGWHNIGLQTGAGVFIDGVHIGLASIALGNNPKARFGSATVYDTLNPTSNHSAGIQLIENLCYLRSYNRSAAGQGIPTGGGGGVAPRVTVIDFDGPQAVTTWEVFDSSGGNNPVAYLAVDSEGDPSRNARFFNSDDPLLQYRESELYLTTGRRVTGQVIRNNADGYVSEGEGAPFVADPEESQPGVAIYMQTDAIGATRAITNSDQNTYYVPSKWTGDIAADFTGTYDYFGISQSWRTPGNGSTDVLNPLSSGSYLFGGASVGSSMGVSNASCGHFYCEVNPSISSVSVESIDQNVGSNIDGVGGDIYDPASGIQFGGWLLPDGYHWPGPDDVEDLVEDAGEYVKESLENLVGAAIAGAGRNIDKIAEAIRPFDDDIADVLSHLAKFQVSLAGNLVGGVASELIDLAIVIAKELASLSDPLSQAKKMMETIKQVTAFAEAALTWTSAEWTAFLGEIGAEAFRAMFNTKLSPKEFIAAATSGCPTKEGEAGAVVAYGIIAIATGILSGGGTVAAKLGAKGFKTIFKSLRKLLKGGIGKIKKLAKNGCFISGTLVWVLRSDISEEYAQYLLDQGASLSEVCKLVAVEDIHRGMIVLSRADNTQSASLEFSKVEQSYSLMVSGVVSITVTSNGQPQSVTATANHPFWLVESDSTRPMADTVPNHLDGSMPYTLNAEGQVVQRNQGWVYTADFKESDLVSVGRSNAGAISNIHPIIKPTRVYNFTVANSNTYFVSSATSTAETSTPIWTHNTKPCKKTPNPAGQKNKHGNPGHPPGKGHNGKSAGPKQKKMNKRNANTKAAKAALEEEKLKQWGELPPRTRKLIGDYKDFIPIIKE